jgi:hypothetical protein
MSEAQMTKVVRIKSSMRTEDYFTRTRSQRDFIAREKQVAEDVSQVLAFEVGFSRHAGGPSMAVALAAWRKARESYERIAKALPLDTALRTEMFAELAERDAVMAKLEEKAERLLERAEGHA